MGQTVRLGVDVVLLVGDQVTTATVPTTDDQSEGVLDAGSTVRIETPGGGYGEEEQAVTGLGRAPGR